MYNDECMSMSKDDIKEVIDSCRKRLGKPVKRKKVQVEPTKEESCCDDPSCPTSTPKKGFGS